MTIFARYEVRGEVSYGIVEGEVIRQITGSLFGGFKTTSKTSKLSEVKLLAPCVPTKILAIGRNYVSHLRGRDEPTKPEPFLKTPSSVIGPDEAIVIPSDCGRVDEEAELVVVMGKRCKKATKEDALSYVFGYSCGNDVSARLWQRGDLQWWRGKSSDTFCPFGPYIVTGLDPANLELKCRINGNQVQATNTKELFFNVPTLINFISQVVTLEPGDLIYTGTPGATSEIRPGDVVEVEISSIGTLSNPVVAEE